MPYRAPAPIGWEEGWLSTPLWFLRALVVVLLLTPVLRPLGQRLSGRLMFGVWIGSLFVLDWWVDHQSSELSTGVVRGVADVVCFGGFFALGASAHHLRYRLSRTRRWVLAVLCLAAAGAWAYVAPPIDWVANNSYVLSGLVGLGWLLAMLALEDQLRHVGEIAAVQRFVAWVTDNSMSIYLWHTLALVLAFYLVGVPNSPGQYIILAAVFAVLLASIVAAVRPLESLGSLRKGGFPKVRAVPIALLILALALVTQQSMLFPHSGEVSGPPTPSGRPFGGAGTTAGEATAVTGATAPGTLSGSDEADVDEEDMARSGDAWLRGHRVAAAAVVEIGQPTDGEPVLVQYGEAEVLDPDAEFEALSITKTMVAAVALQLVDEGKLTLDGAAPVHRGHCHERHRHAHAAAIAEPLVGPPGLPREPRLSRRHDPHAGRGRQPRRVGERPHFDAHELRRAELPVGSVGDRDGHGAAAQ